MSNSSEVLERAAAGGRISETEALELYRHAPLHDLGQAADTARRAKLPYLADTATYIIERNINYTNVCVTACKFCAFYVPPKSPDGWSRDLEEIYRAAARRPSSSAALGRCSRADTYRTTGPRYTSDPSPRSKSSTRSWSSTRSAPPRSTPHGEGLRRAHRGGRRPDQGGRPRLAGRRRRRTAAGPAAHGHRPAQGERRALAGDHGDRAPAWGSKIHLDDADGHR